MSENVFGGIKFFLERIVFFVLIFKFSFENSIVIRFKEYRTFFWGGIVGEL